MTDTKPELSADRVDEVRDDAECDMRADFDPYEMRVASTTLALIASRAQALELLRRSSRHVFGPDLELYEELAAFLERNK